MSDSASDKLHPLFDIGPHVTAMPVVHGSGDFASEVRRVMLKHSFDCVAVPLPESFQAAVEFAILDLPASSAVVQRAIGQPEWVPETETNDELPQSSYVPVEPCQPVIAALRVAMEERIPRQFIDLETNHFQPNGVPLPDAYALKQLSFEKFAAAVLPFIEPWGTDQWNLRIAWMAWQLRQLSVDYRNILFVCNIVDWPWIRDCLLYTSPSPRDATLSRMPSSA